MKIGWMKHPFTIYKLAVLAVELIFTSQTTTASAADLQSLGTVWDSCKAAKKSFRIRHKTLARALKSTFVIVLVTVGVSRTTFCKKSILSRSIQ